MNRSDLNILRRRNLLSWLVLPAVGAAIMMWAHVAPSTRWLHFGAAAIFIGGGGVFARMLFSVKCPQCRWLLHIRNDGQGYPISAVIPEVCPNCRIKLAESYLLSGAT